MTWRRLNRLEEARATYEKLLAIDPEHRDALNNSGVVHELLKQPAQAEKMVRTAHEWIARQFTPERHTDQFLRILKRIIDRKRNA